MGLVRVGGLWPWSTMSRSVTGAKASVEKYRICYHGGHCGDGSADGMWALSLGSDVLNIGWGSGLRLK